MKIYEKYLGEMDGKPEPKQAILKKLSDHLGNAYGYGLGKGKVINVKWKGGDVKFDIFIKSHGNYLRGITYHFDVNEDEIDEILYTGTR